MAPAVWKEALALFDNAGSTVQYVDQILVMHKGRVRERGTHQELLAKRGMYWTLYQLQYKDQELRTPGTAEATA